jgi:hypothetical protein
MALQTIPDHIIMMQLNQIHTPMMLQNRLKVHCGYFLEALLIVQTILSKLFI